MRRKTAKKKKKKAEGNPIVAFRLPAKEIRTLRAFAKAMKYPDVSSFVREFVRAAISGDFTRINEFNGKLMQRLHEDAQLQLQGMGEGGQRERPT